MTFRVIILKCLLFMSVRDGGESLLKEHGTKTSWREERDLEKAGLWEALPRATPELDCDLNWCHHHTFSKAGEQQGEFLSELTGWVCQWLGLVCPSWTIWGAKGVNSNVRVKSNVPGPSKQLWELQGRNRQNFQEISRWPVEEGGHCLWGHPGHMRKYLHTVIWHYLSP